jgi:hypothetical protein
VSNALHVLSSFAISKLDAEPLRVRGEVYRALADLAVTNSDRTSFARLAAECDAVEAHHEQLAFEFKSARRARKTKGTL